MHGSAAKPSSQPASQALEEALEANAAKQRGHRGTMHFMDQTGHTSVTWDMNVPEEVNMAREAFDRLIRAGYSAFEVEGQDQQGRRVTSFDPKAGKLMMVPQLRGG